MAKAFQCPGFSATTVFLYDMNLPCMYYVMCVQV